MPEEPAAKKPTSPASAAAADAFAALPDETLQHVLSFLPAQPAVRTCVLARRWRRLWEGTVGLRITAANAPEPMRIPHDLEALAGLREFVDYLLLLRGDAPLDSCDFMFDVPEDADVPRVNLWIRHVVRCQVRRLQLSITRDSARDLHFYVDSLPLVSRHLRRLELNFIGFNDSFLDLSGCPGLEELYIYDGCFIHAKRISSKSVKHLSVIDSCFSEHFRTIIDVPSTISLRLENPWERTPVLGSMPLLEVAFVRFCIDPMVSLDLCCNSKSGDCDDEHCERCYGLEGETFNGSTANGDKKKKSVLLNGLSQAKSLILIDELKTFIFKRDPKWCPVLRMLKTLLLNEYWCVPPDFHELACLLEHSPVLEKLTLQLFSMGPKHNEEMEGRFSSAVQSAAISKYLKIIAIKCEVVDERVAKVLKFLCTFNICFNF